MSTTTTTQVSAAVSTYYDRLLLQRAKPYLIHTLFAQRRNLPKKSGNTIKFRRYSALSTATTPLSEGITPSGSQLSVTDITAVIVQYGDFVEVTDVVDLTTQDAVITESVEVLGQQMGETIDEVTRDMLSANASSTNCTGGDNGQTPTEITKSDIDGVIKTMMGNNALMISNIIPAGSGFNTVPIAPSYFGLTDTDMTKDLSAVANFVTVEAYAQQAPVMEAEWGQTGRVRWLVSSVGKVTSESPAQYHNFIIGRNAYGATELEGGSARTIIKAFGSGGTSDPLDQRATVSWKTFYVSRILNDNFMHNLESTLDT